jgi:hypothetical protein
VGFEVRVRGRLLGELAYLDESLKVLELKIRRE